jgi:hypothetical protein
LTVTVENTVAGTITGLIVDGTVTYEDCDRQPVSQIPGLQSITFFESTFATPTSTTFAVNSSQLTTQLGTLGSAPNNDFEGVIGAEFYDVFISNWDGTVNPSGAFITIEAVWPGGAPSGGGLNIGAVQLNFANGSSQLANFVSSFVALGNNAIPLDVGKAVDTSTATDTTMGNTFGQTQRLRVTVGFPCCASPPSGMVAWWPLDEGTGATSLQDIIGGNNGGNNATLFASPLGAAQAPQPVSGMVNGAIHFPKFGNGLSGAHVGPQGALAGVGSANFTIDAWVEFQSAPANRLHYIVNKFDTAQNKGYALYVISPGITGNERLEFKWGDGTIVSTVQTISPVTPGQWHHVAMTFARNVGPNALDIRLYVDGIQQGQQTGNPPGLGSLVNFVFLEIGQQPGTIDEPITIDELEIFNVALSLSDIQAIYNAGSAGKCKCGTGGQSMDLTTTGTGAVFGVGSGVGATVTNPVIINYSVQGCSGREMFLVLNAPPMGIPWAYLNSNFAWVPLPTPLSQITPWVSSGPADGLYTLFSGSVPPGMYDLYLACDAIQNGHLDITGPPLCLTGAFDYLPLTVQ